MEDDHININNTFISSLDAEHFIGLSPEKLEIDNSVITPKRPSRCSRMSTSQKTITLVEFSNPLEKDTSKLSVNIRQLIYSYLNMNTLIVKISKLSKKDRSILLTSKIIGQERPLRKFNHRFRENELERSLAYVLKLSSSVPQ